MKIKIFNNLKLNIDLSFIFFIILMLFLSLYNIIYTIILSLFIHELSHILIYVWICKKYNYKGKILLSLSIFGGICTMNYCFFMKSEKILLFSSGIIGTIILLLLTQNNLYFYKYNLLLILFNILPIYPLDGYNILNQFSFFNQKIKKIISYLIILFLFIIVIFSKSFGILIIIMFLIIKNIKNKEEDILNRLNNISYNLKNKGYCIDNFEKI